MFERTPAEELRQLLPGAMAADRLDRVDVSSLDEEGLLAYAGAAQRQAAWAHSRMLVGLAEFAERRDTVEPTYAGQGREQLVRFGGPGTPPVSEFAADEAAAALGMAPTTAGILIGDALDLRHRLPWAATGLKGGEIDLARARVIAAGTRDLPHEAVDRLDRSLFFSAVHLTVGKLRRQVTKKVTVAQHQLAREAAGSETAAEPDAENENQVDPALGALARQFVAFGIREDGMTSELWGELAVDGAQRLRQRIDQVARTLRRSDKATPWEALRARALCLLADPDALGRALHAADQHAGEDETGDDNAGDDASARAVWMPGTVLHVHLSKPTFDDDPAADGVAEIEGAGFVPWVTVRDHLTGCQVTDIQATTTNVRTVLVDPAATTAWEPEGGYTPSPELREHLIARDRGCRFPGCLRPARQCELDHTVPWPRGPTAAYNLGCLCRRHHRLKTHTGWRLAQPSPGVFIWQSPTGRSYRVDDRGTTTTLPDDAPLPAAR